MELPQQQKQGQEQEQESQQIELKLIKDAPVLVFDGSYCIFHRFHATAKWLAFQREGVDIDRTKLNDDVEYVQAFTRHMMDNVKKLMKKEKVPKGNLLWCTDCKRQAIWRNDHHDDYKGGRVGGAFDPRIFRRFHTETLLMMQEQFGMQVLDAPALEADDLAYLVCQNLLAESATNPICIYTNDNDYLQLGHACIKIQNLSGKDLATRGKGTPMQNMWLKVVIGDKSDNIKSVGNKCGPKTGWSIVVAATKENGEVDPVLIEESVRSRYGEDGITKLAQNRSLIDMSCIPDNLRPNITVVYK